MKDKIKGVYITKSEQETRDLGQSIGKVLEEGDVLLLSGEPGAGKTVFTRGIAAGMGIKGYITSPTFTIINEYDGSVPLYHMDAYRIGNASEMESTGFQEYITDGGLYGPGVVVVEWPGNISGLLPENAIKVNIQKFEDNRTDTREIEILE